MSDADTTVRALLAAAGLSPNEAEIASLVEAYPAHRAGVESLYAVAAAKYAAPALVFNPTPSFADWAV